MKTLILATVSAEFGTMTQSDVQQSAINGINSPADLSGDSASYIVQAYGAGKNSAAVNQSVGTVQRRRSPCQRREQQHGQRDPVRQSRRGRHRLTDGRELQLRLHQPERDV